MISRKEARDFFFQQFGEEPGSCACAPGRVNLIGEHIDYAGGQVLPLSICQGITVLARSTTQGLLRIASQQFADDGVVTLDSSGMQNDRAGYIQELARQTGARSAEIAILSDLPIGQGLSSSAALGIAVQAAMLALQADAVRPTALQLCKAAQQAEHLALGTSCGLMDQYASMFGRVDSAVLIDTWREVHHYIPLSLDGLSLLIVDSGQPRELAASQYNARHAEMSSALAALRKLSGGFESFRELPPLRFRELLEQLPEPAQSRLRHLTTEQGRVFALAKALEGADGPAMGRLLSESHASLRDNAAVSTAEIDKLSGLLRELPGCLGARLMGGGFGGSVLALMDGAVDRAAMEEVLQEYHAHSGLSGSWLRVEAGPGAWLENPRGDRTPLTEWLA
jgi:galactokinase